MDTRQLLIGKPITLTNDLLCFVSFAESASGLLVVRGRLQSEGSIVDVLSKPPTLMGLQKNTYEFINAQSGGAPLQQVFDWIYEFPHPEPLVADLVGKTTIRLSFDE